MSRRPFLYLLMSLCALSGSGGLALAADLAPVRPLVAGPVAAPMGWSYRMTPYGWLIALKGTQTVRGRSAKIDASFGDIVEMSDSLISLMNSFEARNGPLTLYNDLVWTKIGVEGSNIQSRSLAPGVTGMIGTTTSLDFQMAIVEVGATYEVLRSGSLAFDVLGGARYWYQEANLSLELARTIDSSDLDLAGGLAIARSGSVSWLDPVIGARVRYAMAPGHELFLRGDIGGFGVGSDFSWQAIGGYSFDFGIYNGTTFSGVIGYRALSVDYTQGEGRRRYQFDAIQHGPIFGISARF